MKRGLIIALVLLSAVGAGYWYSRNFASGAGPAAGPRPNVLLITIDTLRADRVGGPLTPNINEIASRGTSFRDVRATAPLTLPSHVSIMTGTIPPVHGVRENGVVFDRKVPTLARTLRDAGYRTAAFVGAYVLNRRFGLDDGFDTYDDTVRRNMARAEQLEAERPANEVIDAALAWLNAAPSDRPFFLWTHLYDPHAPYDPPKEFLDKAGGNAYDGEVAFADAQVGRLVAGLKARGLLDATLIVVTGDHGEGLGDHGEETHGMLVYDATARVPLVVSEQDGGLAGTSLSLTGISPLILARVGPDDHLLLFLGRCGNRCDVYTESLYPRRAGWHALTSLADEQWKLIASSESELYDLRRDPAERQNVAARHPGVVQAMSARLAKLGSASPPQTVASDAAERLRALGYVSGSSAITSDDPKAPNPARVIDAWTEFERALGLLQAGRARDAVAILRVLAARHPEAPVFQSTYAQALREAGRPREAVVIYRSAVAKWPGDSMLFHDLAVAARDAGDLDEAMRAQQAALALDASSPMAQNGLGLLHADAGRLPEAIAAFERATHEDPTNASYWTNLGNARRAAGSDEAAEGAYRRALEIDAEFPDALNGLGTILVQQGRGSDAIPLFERALRREPALHEARLNLGIAYQESGNLRQAAEAYRELLATAPSSARREREAAAELLKALR